MNPVCSFILQGWSSTRRISYLIIPREKNWLCTEMNRRETQEIEELKNFCCTEAERAKPLRIDELTVQDKANKSTVNRLAVLQEIQDKVNSLIPEEYMITKWQAVLSYPTFPSLRVLRVQEV